MTISVCPVALKGMGKCRNRQCRLRHDVVRCKPCKRFVLRGDLRKHRRGGEHRLNCGFGPWKEVARLPAQAIPPSHRPYVPKPKPSEKRARRPAWKEKPADTGGLPPGGEVTRYLSVSGEEGLDFRLEVGAGKYKKTKSKIPLIIQKIVDNDSLTLVGVNVTGAGSGEFSAIAAGLPMKIRAKKQQTVQVSFVPTAPGECDARLVLSFLHVSKGKPVTLTIARRLHGVATSPVAKPRSRTPKKPVNIKRTPGIRESQGSSKIIQLRGTSQHRDAGRDGPRSH